MPVHEALHAYPTKSLDGSEEDLASSQATDGNIHMPRASLHHQDHTFQPTITTRYPPTDYADNPLNPMILHFCYPSGDIIVPTRQYQMPRVHHFVLTNEKGRKVYGTCLTILEEYVPRGPWKSRAVTTRHDSLDGVEVSIDDDTNSVLYLPKVLCLLSTWPYLSAFREYLAQLYRLASATNVMTAPIERYVVNLCKEIPAPPPGAYEVQVSILDSTIRFWAPPAKLPIAYVAVPYQILFDCLDTEHILQVWSALVMERKVLLLSSQYSILTICSEIFSSLLFPLRWNHLYVPLLPRMLCPMLDAPVPFFCGIVREDWLYAQQFVSEDIIVVDLDHNKVRFGRAVPRMPSFPTKKIAKLRTSLQETIGHVFWTSRGLEMEYRMMTMNKKSNKRSIDRLRSRTGNGTLWVEKLAGLDHAFNLAYTPDSHLLDDTSLLKGDTMQSKWDRVQEAFLRFFVALLKDYRKYLIVPQSNLSSSELPIPSFDLIAFLASQKTDNTTFLVEMCMTQQFDDFISRRIYRQGEPDLIFFDESIDAKLNRSRLKLKKVDTPVLQNAKAHKVLTKFSALLPNEVGLPGTKFENKPKPYVYKSWPETLNEGLFSEPRPIPTMIAAEFDRQAMLIQRLRADVDDHTDDSDAILHPTGAEYDPSPEVAAFTVFFFAYSALVGLEWQTYERKCQSIDKEASGNQLSEGTSSDGEKRVDVAQEGKAALPEEEVFNDRNVNTCLSDFSMGLCDSCPSSGIFVFNKSLRFIGDSAEAYESVVENTANHMARLQSQIIVSMETASDVTKPVDILAEFEEAKEVASAQLDLAFEALTTMSLRGLKTDSDAYKSLMEACGRCGDTERALKLMQVMKVDGFFADSEILAWFIAAFAQESAGKIDPPVGTQEVSSDNSLLRKSNRGLDVYSDFLRKKFWPKNEDDNSSLQLVGNDLGEHDDVSTDPGITASDVPCHTNRAVPIFGWFKNQDSNEKRRRWRKEKVKATLETRSMHVTDMLFNQLALGDSLLDFLHPDLVIDTRSDVCPQCSCALSENEIVAGWTSCAFNDYTTECPNCSHRFVPRFSITSSSPTFTGSQGPRTPLYCEFLSPWVLRKALQHVVKGDIGIRGMMKPEWRSGTDIRATIFWNLVVMCRRYRLPFSFLLQGNFQNRIILPRTPGQL
jgi:pentatricopeptide repeat protein